MAYDSPFSGPYGGAGPALPPGYMEMATQPGRDVQGLLKSIGEKFKERREKKKQEAKELKATRSLAKALGVDRLGMDEASIETADVDTIMGKIQAWQAKNRERELEVKEEPGKRSAATVKVMQHMLGGQAEQLRAQDAYGAEPGGPGGGPLDEQEANKLRAIQSILPHMEGMEPSMIETILELSQGGGGRRAGDTFELSPAGGVGMYTSKGGKSAAVVSGIPKAPTELERSRSGYYDAQKAKVKAETKSEELYHDVMKGFGGGKTDTKGMDIPTKRKVTKLESEIAQAQTNIERLTLLEKDQVPFVNYDDGVINLEKSRAQEAGKDWTTFGEATRSDSMLKEKQKLTKLQKQLAKLRGDSGGAAIPRPPVTEIDPMAPENLFPSE